MRQALRVTPRRQMLALFGGEGFEEGLVVHADLTLRCPKPSRGDFYRRRKFLISHGFLLAGLSRFNRSTNVQGVFVGAIRLSILRQRTPSFR